MRLLLDRLDGVDDVYVFRLKEDRKYLDFDVDSGLYSEVFLCGVQHQDYDNYLGYDCYWGIPVGRAKAGDFRFVDFSVSSEGRWRVSAGSCHAALELWGRYVLMECCSAHGSLWLFPWDDVLNLSFWQSKVLFRRLSDGLVEGYGTQQGFDGVDIVPFQLKFSDNGVAVPGTQRGSNCILQDSLKVSDAFIDLGDGAVIDNTGLSVSFVWASPNIGYLCFGNYAIQIGVVENQIVMGQAGVRVSYGKSFLDCNYACIRLFLERQTDGFAVLRFCCVPKNFDMQQYFILEVDMVNKVYAIHVNAGVVSEGQMLSKGKVAKMCLLGSR